MSNEGELYYRRAICYFELDQYEQAVQNWICAYELNYNRGEILDNLYQCFILPNENEFRNNFQQNNNWVAELTYADCVLDFIPVDEQNFYIFNRESKIFGGKISLDKLSFGQKDCSRSALYVDTWDVREIVKHVYEKNYGNVYLYLDKYKKEFVSFLKLPMFAELCIEKIKLFYDEASMRKFFFEQPFEYLPKQVIAENAENAENAERYLNIIENIQQRKKCHNIMFLMGQSQYGALRRFMENLSSAFREIGYNTVVIDLLEEDWYQQINTSRQRYEFDAVISYNLVGYGMEGIDHIGKKFISSLCDHPIWHESRLKSARENVIVWCGDRYDYNYVKQYYPNIGKVDFSMSGSAEYLEEDVAFEDRIFDVVFIGGYNNPEDIYVSICQMYTGQILDLVKAFINKLIEYPNLTYENALRKTLDDFGLYDIVDDKFNDVAGEFCIVNRYIRSYFRDKVVREIIQNKIILHVSGNGWENFQSEYIDYLVIENNDWYTARKMVANAKISLNVMPWFKAGFHDRATLSMLSGAILLTDSSEYIEANFTDMDDIAIFYLSHIEEISKKINYLLSHVNEAKVIAQKGKKIAMQKFRWEELAEDMAKTLREEIIDTIPLEGMGIELNIQQQGAHRKSVAQNVLVELKDTDQILQSFHSGTTRKIIRAKDYNYVVSQLKKITDRLILDFPELQIGSYVWEQISDLNDPVPGQTFELVEMQIGYLMKKIEWECLEVANNVVN